MTCQPSSAILRTVVESTTRPTSLLGFSRGKRKVRLSNEGPANIYIVTAEDHTRSQGFLFTPMDTPLTLDIETGLWALIENDGSRATICVLTEIGEAR